ncbi:MAG: hypothetical protein HYS55_02215 [Candidatus Omnitrophica bacterium]|nr:hypothetical protein [Candidatus Omnitrophota bacterium]
MFLNSASAFPTSEVFEETKTQVIIREHPKTGKPYVSIVSQESFDPNTPFLGARTKVSRPDYRMLDPKVKSGEIPYDGPYSSAKKVYIFAATLATLGVAGGAVGMAVAPAASAGGAASGGGTFLAAGGAVAAGSAGGAVAMTRSDSNVDDFIQTSESRTIETPSPGKKNEITN